MLVIDSVREIFGMDAENRCRKTWMFIDTVSRQNFALKYIGNYLYYLSEDVV